MSQPTHGSRLFVLMAMIVLSKIEMLWPSCSSFSWTPWKLRNAASVTTNDGTRTFATMMPSVKPMTMPMAIANRTAQYQAQWCSVSTHRHRGRADAAGEAGGEVDLAEQQHEDQAHRDEDDGGALLEQVREVAFGEEVGPQDAEDDAGDDEADDGRKGPDVAAADFLHVRPEVIGQRLFLGDDR